MKILSGFVFRALARRGGAGRGLLASLSSFLFCRTGTSRLLVLVVYVPVPVGPLSLVSLLPLLSSPPSCPARGACPWLRSASVRMTSTSTYVQSVPLPVPVPQLPVRYAVPVRRGGVVWGSCNPFMCTYSY
jgi:hypothetical protein